MKNTLSLREWEKLRTIIWDVRNGRQTPIAPMDIKTSESTTRRCLPQIYEEPILSHIGTVESIPNETRLTLTPNPAIAGETVDLKVANTLETPKQIKLGIYDLTGNQIASRTLNEYNATFTAPATSGIYIVKVTGNGFTQSCKLIVK